MKTLNEDANVALRTTNTATRFDTKGVKNTYVHATQEAFRELVTDSQIKSKTISNAATFQYLACRIPLLRVSSIPLHSIHKSLMVAVIIHLIIIIMKYEILATQ